MTETFNPAEAFASASPVAEVASTAAATDMAPAVLPQNQSLAAPVAYTNDEDARGEFTPDDIQKATMQIVPATGKLTRIANAGDILLNKELIIGGKTRPVTVIAAGIEKLYQQDLDFDSGDEPEKPVKTAQEVIARGGIVDWRPFGDTVSTHFWKPILRGVFLIERPADIGPDAAAEFVYTIAGKEYTLASFWAASKTAWMGVAQPLIKAKSKTKNVRLATYKLSTSIEQSADGKKTWVQPRVRATGDTAKELLEFMGQLRG